MELNGQTTNLGGVVNPIPNNVPNVNPVVNNIPQNNQFNGMPIPENPTGSNTVTSSVVAQPAQPVQPVNNYASWQVQPGPMTNGQIPQPVQPTQPAQVVEPVVQPAVEQPVVNNTANAQPTQTTEHQQPTNIIDNKPVEPIVSDSFLIRTADLLKVLNNADKVCTDNSDTVMTQTLQLIFNSEGLTIKCTDKTNYLTQVINSVKYKQEMTIGVFAKQLKPLISKLQVEMIEVIPNYENRTLVIKADQDTFNLAESYDTVDGSNIVIQDIYVDRQQDIRNINYEEYKTKIDNATKAMSSPSIDRLLSGIYSSDIIAATDRDMMFISPNIPQITDKKFYLTTNGVSQMLSIDFGDGEVKMGFVEEEGEVIAVIVSSDTATYSTPTSEDIDQFPTEVLDDISKRDLDSTFTVDTKRAVNVLELVNLFVSPITDKQLSNFAVDASSNQLIVSDINGGSKQHISMKTIKNAVPAAFKLNSLKLLNIFKDTSCDEVTVNVGRPEEQPLSFVKINYNDIIIILTMSELN